MQIKHTSPLPGICGNFACGELSEGEPFVFRAPGFVQYLTEPEWKALKKYVLAPNKNKISTEQADASALGDKAEPTEETPEKQPAEDKKQHISGLELLRAKYAALKSKNSAEGVKLRAEIKKLEAAEDKK